MNENDNELLGGLRAGDPASFEQLVSTYSGRLLATASRILGNENDAQDVVQDALISAWKNIRGFEGSSGLYTWLHRIVVNACLAVLRTARSRTEARAPAAVLAFEGLPAAWSEPGPSLEKRVAMRRAIQRALDAIPEAYRTVLLLRDVEEMTSREVAERLAIPDTAVRQRLHRARAAMAEILRPELCNGPDLTCGGQFDLLMDYIDGGLPPEMQSPVHSHVETCQACNPLLHTYRWTIGVPKAVAELTAVNDVDGQWVKGTVAKALNP